MKKCLPLLIFAIHFLVFSLAGDCLAAPDGNETVKGSISGMVIDGETGGAIASALVEAYTCEEDVPRGSTTTDAQGQYRLGPIDNGCYVMRFSRDGYESSWYGDPPLKESALEVVVADNQVTGIDAPITAAGAVISGQVKDSNGHPLSGAWVTAIRAGSESFSVTDGRSDNKGNFKIGAYPGKYVVAFARPGYVSAIYGGNLNSPVMIDTTQGKTTTGIDMTLGRGGKIAGQVVDETGRGLPEIKVAVMEELFPVLTETGPDGRFVLDGVPSGNHRIGFFDINQAYQHQWFDGQNGPEGASRVKVVAPGKVEGIKAVLKKAGGLSGMVTDAAGNGIPDVTVFARSVDGQEGGAGIATTSETGEYTVSGLSSGKYLVIIQPNGTANLPRYYPDAADMDAAVPVEVTAPRITYGINQVLPRGSALSGRVRNSSGEPIQGVFVSVYPAAAADAQPMAYGFSDPDGKYDVVLSAGEYVVKFDGTGAYLSQWSGGHAERSEAEVLAVTPDNPTLLDVVLPLGAAISGTVRTQVGEGLPGVKLKATDVATGLREASGTSAEDGTYLIQGLPTGQYNLVATGTDVGYIRVKLPQPVEVRAPGKTENIDFVMTPGGSIQGTVVDEQGAPLAEVLVEVHDPSIWSEVANTETDDAGVYEIGGLPANSYSIRFDKDDYVVQWYNGKHRRDDAEEINVVGTSSVTGLNAIMTKGLSLSGMVTSSAGVPLHDAVVEIYGEVEDEPFNKVYTNLDGSFAVPSLAPGSYRIRFGHDDHSPQWYGGKVRREATPLLITEAANTKISATLTMNGPKVAGKLLNTNGEDIGQAWMTVVDAATGQEVADERICECSGKFDIPVRSGNYRLRVERHGKTYWYNDEATAAPQILAVNGVVSGLRMTISETSP